MLSQAFIRAEEEFEVAVTTALLVSIGKQSMM